ncbi:peptidoglycan editing factor PgeF [Pararhizobium haloflavum]|uniref:peptidoglycan editing factor PgeF n=1 Tax=Pararhizobium haloflavum TaxID=2037914 RepID=UPI000C19A7CA|nr:peptidoglycan editing factor PgeF [Pararhizobium haloflavum]
MLADGRPEPIESPLLGSAVADGGIRHGFFTRIGGVSGGIYKGLNVGMGSDDRPDDIKVNRCRVAGWFGQTDVRLVTPHQIHSPQVVVVSEPFGKERPRADAVVTATPSLVIGVLTADCGPVLFVDPEARVIGAAHAGWRGALSGVLEETIEAMVKLGARRDAISAALGPSISRTHYEVGPEFVENFRAVRTENERYFSPSAKTHHAMFDLPAYTLDRLAAAGVSAEWTGHCTYADEDRFFSYRRTTHRGEPDYGRQIAAIAITE